jgi:hypothetical protein
MLWIADTLPERFPFIRAALYNLSGRKAFRETSLYPPGGTGYFAPVNTARNMGDRMDLRLAWGAMKPQGV